jgi:hypothetical protein
MAPLPSVQIDRQIRKQYVYLLFVFMSMICCVLFGLATNYVERLVDMFDS